MKSEALFFAIFLLMLLPSAFASIVKVEPSTLNASWNTTLNISVNNTELINVSKVSVYLPSDFKDIMNIGTSVSPSLVINPSQVFPLVWTNATPEGFVENGTTEYFWFTTQAPSVPSNTNFTILIDLTYLNSSEELFEINVTIKDVDAPIFSDLSFSKANNTKYSPGANYGFQIKWKDNVSVSSVIFSSNFNTSVNLTASLFSGNEREGIYIINFTDLASGIYWFVWYANDTSGNWYNTSNITYVVSPADNFVTVYLNGIPTNYTVLENGTSINITAIAKGTIYLFKNASKIKYDENRLEWNETLGIGIYEFKANVSSVNANYSSNFTGASFFVKVIYPRPRFKDLQAPSSLTYSPGASYTFKITFYSPSYPTNNITNVSFVLNNQVYYLSINNPHSDTYTFTVKDLAAGSYNWLFCANDTQGESNCTSGTLTISQARPNLDIINVQDYLAPVNKTIIGVGCPSQLVCKLYLNDSELPNRFYELSTDKGGYYIFTFNTSGNANYSAASITKTMTVYPPKQTSTNETVSTTTTTTTPVSQQPSSSQTTNIQDVQANIPTIFKINNQELFKVTEIEITATENIKNAEVRVDIPLPTEISTNFVEKNKVFLTYLKITTNISSEKIANAKIRFKVEKTWVNVNNIDSSKVFLYKLVDGNWIQLPTQKITEDNNNIYYESTLNSFSIFVIAGEIKTGFPWHLALIPVVIIIVAIVAYLFWPTSTGSEYDKLKQKWSSGGFGK
jgi:PGF-pre-PGF domain-containing protein